MQAPHITFFDKYIYNPRRSEALRGSDPGARRGMAAYDRRTVLPLLAEDEEVRYQENTWVREALSLITSMKSDLERLVRMLTGGAAPEVPGRPKTEITVRAHHTIDVWKRTQREEDAMLGFTSSVRNVGHRAKRFLKAGVNPWSETGWTAEELATVRNQPREVALCRPGSSPLAVPRRPLIGVALNPSPSLSPPSRPRSSRPQPPSPTSCAAVLLVSSTPRPAPASLPSTRCAPRWGGPGAR